MKKLMWLAMNMSYAKVIQPNKKPEMFYDNKKTVNTGLRITFAIM